MRDTIGQYQILEVLGEGGMGTVYRGVDPLLERAVAIKALRPELAREAPLVERFRAEAVTLARLNHPNIATLYNFFQEGAEYFMVMEHVPGQTLEALLKQSGALPVARASLLFDQALEGIAHAHRFGIIHRDIKPANLMLTDDGTVKVMDFGIARVLGTARMTRTGRLIGTLEYMAPEQIQGREGDARTDVYALGILFYEMVTGHAPFEADSEYALMQAHIEQPPPRTRLASLSEGIEALMLRALEKDPADRFQTVQALREALQDAQPSTPKQKPPAQTRLADTPEALPSSPDELPKATRQADASVLAPQTRLADEPSSALDESLRHLSTHPRYLGVAAGVVALLLVGFWMLGDSDAPETPPSEPAVTRPSSQPAASGFMPPRGSALPPPATEQPPSTLSPVEEPMPSVLPPTAPTEQWLEQARAYFAEDKLTAPLGENAFELCQRILAEDPAHAGAQALLRDIANRYATWGDARLARDDFEQALNYYEKSLLVIESAEVAQKRDRAAALLASQSAKPEPPPASTAQPDEAFRQIVSLPAHTEVRVRLLRTLSSADNFRKGDAVDFAVVEDVMVSGHVLISRGARATGTIEAEREGRVFRRGELRFSLQSVQAIDGRRVTLASDLFGIEGARGQNVTLKQGTVYLARVARATPVGLR